MVAHAFNSRTPYFTLQSHLPVLSPPTPHTHTHRVQSVLPEYSRKCGYPQEVRWGTRSHILIKLILPLWLAKSVNNFLAGSRTLCSPPSSTMGFSQISICMGWCMLSQSELYLENPLSLYSVNISSLYNPSVPSSAVISGFGQERRHYGCSI